MIPLLARSACARTGLLGGAAPLLRPARATVVPRRAVPPLQLRATSTTRRVLAPAPSQTQTAVAQHKPAPPPVTYTASPPDWLDRCIPAGLARTKPYLRLLRLNKPTGAVLLYWPGAQSIMMASTALAMPWTTPVWYCFLFAVGALVMRGAGCIINDMWDARMDAKVERTKMRPIAAGEVTYTGATVFLGSQLLLGLGVLSQLNTYSILLGAASLPLVAIYPFMKRVTYYPQLTLGTVFTWGALLGWSAVAGSVNWAVCGPLWLGHVLHCVAYDTIYAHQDKRDDVLAGVKSTALAWGDKSKPIIATLYSAFVGCLAIAGHAMGAGPIYYAVSVVGAAAQLAWQVITVNLDDTADCWRKFVSNAWLGGLIFLGTVGDYVQQVLLAGWF
ncbi:hypothetical protein VHUM_04272 [Vanrija humicola]|uniref:4-hydroxybenzoate polyprenyltransferase, mitochondrial n=1 Tax=Vanrija humicola TaxID=5417 RepID=A0A7D8UYD7_VANHU|nr:hypothetical protein VHUM_04272 [Vanrija humicola]